MRYNLDNIIDYLFRRKLVNSNNLFSNLKIEEIEGRNYSLIVRTKNQAFFIKQLNEKKYKHSLYNENLVYQLLNEIKNFDKYIVKIIDYDEYENILILEKVSGENLFRYYRRIFKNKMIMNTDIFDKLGKALALLHFQY